MELGFGAKTQQQKKGETKFQTDIFFFGKFGTVSQTHKLDYFA